MNQDEQVARNLLGQGMKVCQAGHVKEALVCWTEARTIFLRLGLEREVAACEMGIGVALRVLGQPQEAIEHYQQAKAVFSRLGFEMYVAPCDGDIGIALNDLGQPQEAMEHFQRAKAIFSRLGMEMYVADCEMNIGTAFSVLGQPQEAMEHHQRARAVFSRLGFEMYVAPCEMNIGIALNDLGQPQEAIEHHQRASAVYSRLGFEKDVAACEMNIGNALGDLGQPQEAIEHHQRAKAVFSRLGSEKEVADCENNIGNALSVLGQPQEAIEHYQRASAVYSRLGFEKKVADCENNTGVALADLASYQQALRHLDDAILKYEQLRSNISVATHRISFFEQFVRSNVTAIRCCLHLGRIADALHYLERSRAKSLAEAVSSNLIPDRAEVGEELYAEFLNLRSRLLRLGILPLIRSDSGPQTRAEAGGSERGQAQHDFDSLVQRIATRFPDSTFARRLEATEVRYLKDIAEYVSLLPDNRSCLLEFLTWADDGRLRAFLVTKQNGLELLTFPEGSIGRVKEVFNRWVGIYDGARSSRERADIVWETCHELHETIFSAEVELMCEAGGQAAPTTVRSRRLLDHLNATLEEGDNEHPRRMYLIPHSYLFLLPLHAACWDDRQGAAETASQQKPQPRPRYLIEDYVVTYAPSAYLLKVSREREYQRPQQPRALVVGNPQPLSDASPLPYATVEADDVATQLEGAGWKVDRLIEEKATKQRFLNGDEQGVAGINSGVYDHLHQAQHAGISVQDHQAYFCFGQSSDNHYCSGQDIAGAPLHKTKSVVAAACLTSFTSPAVNEYLGMGAAYLQAGVGTFIGTLYPLSDKGSSELVPELYRLHLQEGLSWADALRRAQLQMVEFTASGGSKVTRQGQGEKELELLEKYLKEHLKPEDQQPPLDHPYHWAAFTVSGKD
jgi:CHAT domain-containing protein/tetratricopeptide (TPR) repeat protein